MSIRLSKKYASTYLSNSQCPITWGVSRITFLQHAHSSPDEGLTTSCGWLCVCVCVMGKTTPVWMHTQLMSEIPHCSCPHRGRTTRAARVQKAVQSSHKNLPSLASLCGPLPLLAQRHPNLIHVSSATKPFFYIRAEGKTRREKQDLLSDSEFELSFIVRGV